MFINKNDWKIRFISFAADLKASSIFASNYKLPYLVFHHSSYLYGGVKTFDQTTFRLTTKFCKLQVKETGRLSTIVFKSKQTLIGNLSQQSYCPNSHIRHQSLLKQ